MALANGRIPQGWSSSHALIHGGWAASPQLSLNELFEGDPICSPCSLEEALSVVDFRGAPGGWCGSNSSLLDFEQGDGVTCTGIADPSWLADGRSYSDMISAYGSIGSPVREVEIQKRSRSTPLSQEGEEVPSPKKRCGNARTIKEKSSPSKDPQTLAAKNRRERISERLRTLQDLVPNGAKACIFSNSLPAFDSANHSLTVSTDMLQVDLVTMLEKAINYVKFLQLQVKVLATDEFWPAQGGKAPDTAQVKEAIDAILSSHRDRNCSSNQ
ncbi:hypothetical protein OPV22_003655 [Ensete ventricosum]|uniref:BHLH domain-containing protein n=1 Tax=Ensete ventricosum TaxID=4639 RepID=A0AAV8S1G6_ENSVE|nr:hypothetical protein OPV22_003655 [Ensete ventricosum]